MSVERSHLRVIHGGLYREVTFGSTRLVLTERPYRSPDAVLFEENTHLAMSGSFRAGDYPAPAGGGLPRSQPPVMGGSVLVRPGRPTEMFLVVNDGGSQPAVRRGWLERAWLEVFREAERLKLSFLVAPLIGGMGGAPLEEVLSSVVGVMSLGSHRFPRTIEIACGSLAEQAYAALAHYAHPVRH